MTTDDAMKCLICDAPNPTHLLEIPPEVIEPYVEQRPASVQVLVCCACFPKPTTPRLAAIRIKKDLKAKKP